MDFYIEVKILKIQSKILGEIEIEESAIIHFPDGIPAFEEERRFAIVPMDESGPFYYLQAVNRPELCLVIADPFVFFPDYQVEVPEPELQRIQAEEGKNISLLSVLTIPDDFRQTTANLFAPLLIDTGSKKGIQFIPEKSLYSTKHSIFTSESSAAPAAAGQGE